MADYPGDRWHSVRETVLVAARSAGLQAIDGPHLDVGDLEGLAVEAGRARALGLDGKWVLHPAQIEPVNDVFSPAQEEVDRAGAIIAALSEARRPRRSGPGRRDGRRGQPQAGCTGRCTGSRSRAGSPLNAGVYWRASTLASLIRPYWPPTLKKLKTWPLSADVVAVPCAPDQKGWK